MATPEGGQTYCLRWNNHRTNLAQILQSLGYSDSEEDLSNHSPNGSSIADCTLRVDGGYEFRAHRVVLAASSPYLRAALSGASPAITDNCPVVLVVPGVAREEMRVLLEYMYTGEVRVARADIARVMRIAEQLEVKGLFDMRDSRLRFDGTPGPETERAPSPDITTTTTASGDEHQQNKNTSVRLHEDVNRDNHHEMEEENENRRTPNDTAERHLPNEAGCISPYDNIYPRSPPESIAPLSTAWPGANLSQPGAPYGAARALSAAYGACADMNPLKRKKLHSMLTSSNSKDGVLQDRYRRQQEQLQDTPILRNVLAQHAPDSSQQTNPVALCRSRDMRTASDGSTDAERPMRGDESPYTDKSYDDDFRSSQLDNNSNSHHHNSLNNHISNQSNGAGSHNNSSTSPLLYASHAAAAAAMLSVGGYGGHKTNGGMVNNNLASYTGQPPQPARERENNNHGPQGSPPGSAPGQKPEWKRYKQYSRNDIMCAIECVRNGMSALQASRKYNVPSRTLYDKVKKMGITTSRPMNRSFKRGNSLSPATIPYNISGSSSGYAGPYDGEEQPPPHPAAALLDVKFLQQALEGRGGAELAGREALHAMAIAAAAHAAVSGLSASPGNHGNARSPSPGLKFSHRLNNHEDSESANHLNHRLTNHINHLNNQQHMLKSEPMDNEMEEDNEVEDLSMSRKQPAAIDAVIDQQTSFQPVQSPPLQQTGVIVQPLPKTANGEEAMERG